MSEPRRIDRRTNYTNEALYSKYFVSTGKRPIDDPTAFDDWCVENGIYSIENPEPKEGKKD